jgi:hypothetical protein
MLGAPLVDRVSLLLSWVRLVAPAALRTLLFYLGLAVRSLLRSWMLGAMKCPKCDAEMEGGFLLDRGWSHKVGQALLWVESDQSGIAIPVRGDGLGQLEVDAYRCTGCGFVELYAGTGKGE